jgi:hypothetical protein
VTAPNLIIFDNFITSKECDDLIQIHKDFNNHRTHRNTIILDLIEHSVKNNFLEVARQYWGENVTINYTEIVYWPVNESQDMHLDFDYHVLTSVLYLNDNFTGGRTIFNDGSFVAPKKGRIVFFLGNKLVHGVEPVLFGERWTCPTWYKLKG